LVISIFLGGSFPLGHTLLRVKITLGQFVQLTKDKDYAKKHRIVTIKINIVTNFPTI